MSAMVCTCPQCGGKILVEVKTEISAQLRQAAVISRSDQIVYKHAEINGLFPGDLRGRNRSRIVAHARQDAMREMRERGNMSLSSIQKYFGLQCHTTVRHGIKASKARERKLLLMEAPDA